jgi:hypothetical protein
MAKAKKKRAEKYEEKLAINGTFEDVIGVSVKPLPDKSNNSMSTFEKEYENLPGKKCVFKKVFEKSSTGEELIYAVDIVDTTTNENVHVRLKQQGRVWEIQPTKGLPEWVYPLKSQFNESILLNGD